MHRGGGEVVIDWVDLSVRAPLLEAALVSPEATRRAAATEMFLLYYLADENERRHPTAASGVNWRSTVNANVVTTATVARRRNGGGGGGGGGASSSSPQSPARAAHNVARVAPVMLSLLFDGWGAGGGGGSRTRGWGGGGGGGASSSAAAVGSAESERVAQTAAVILGHFADSEVNSAAMVRGGALGTLQRALKERTASVASSLGGGAVGRGLADDPLSRLIREVMGRLVNDTDTGADFMRTAMRAAAQ